MPSKPHSHDDPTKSQVVPPLPAGRRLLVVWPSGSSTHDLPDFGTLLVGRSKECDIVIDHPSVSRRHAKFHTKPSLSVEDLGSSNGTRVAGRRLASNVVEPVPSGGLVQVGVAMLVVQEPGAMDPRPVLDETRAARRQPAPSNAMESLHRLIDLVAPGRISIILQGETGVGKEVAAERVHASSPRAGKPLVRVNCAALPEPLLEGELFGYERGAFTGAAHAKPGMFETADGGTILLDEIGELSAATQVKLLRVLESRDVQRLGAVRARTVDVRVLTATHRDVAALVAAGTLRADLYYRLNGITLVIPPLRERLDEIPALARTFVDQACAQIGRPGAVLTPQVLEALAAHTWPGNIRELKNTLERAVLLAAGGPIEPSHVHTPPGVPTAPAGGSLRHALQDMERQRIVDALAASHGNQTRAAKLLGISRRTLLDRLDTYGLPRPQKRSPNT